MDIGEQFEFNGQIDWIDDDLNSIINATEECEPWDDTGLDNIPDSLEFLQTGNNLTSNIIHDLNSLFRILFSIIFPTRGQSL